MRWPFASPSLAAAISALLAACASAPQPETSAPVTPAALGQAKATAIEVCGPPGQRAYLDQLVCANGERPSYRRVGNVGPRTALPRSLSEEEAAARFKRAFSARALKPGEPDEHVVDGYEVVCAGARQMIYMDMYHCEQAAPTTPPPGFKFRPLNAKIVSR